MKLRHTLIFSLMLVMLAGCHSNQEILSTDQMVNILFDIYRVDAAVLQTGHYISDTDRARYYNGIFEKHDTDKATFDRSLEWYSAHPEQWRLVYKDLESKSETFLAELQSGELAELKQRGIMLSNIDTLDFWLSSESMYWYRDENQTVDTDRVCQTIKGRKYFFGAKKLDLTFRMRCVADSDVSVRTSMIVYYSRDQKADTFHVVANANGRWYRYRLSTGTARKGISSVTVTVADSATITQLSSIEYEDMHLNYLYPKDGEHIDNTDKQILNRQRSNRLIRQRDSNEKRNANGEKSSSKLRQLPRFPVMRRHG